jgi:hypothetical protein
MRELVSFRIDANNVPAYNFISNKLLPGTPHR